MRQVPIAADSSGVATRASKNCAWPVRSSSFAAWWVFDEGPDYVRLRIV